MLASGFGGPRLAPGKCGLGPWLLWDPRLAKISFWVFLFCSFPPHLAGKNAYEWFRALLYGEWELLIMYVPCLHFGKPSTPNHL